MKEINIKKIIFVYENNKKLMLNGEKLEIWLKEQETTFKNKPKVKKGYIEVKEK